MFWFRQIHAIQCVGVVAIYTLGEEFLLVNARSYIYKYVCMYVCIYVCTHKYVYTAHVLSIAQYAIYSPDWDYKWSIPAQDPRVTYLSSYFLKQNNNLFNMTLKYTFKTIHPLISDRNV